MIMFIHFLMFKHSLTIILAIIYFKYFFADNTDSRAVYLGRYFITLSIGLTIEVLSQNTDQASQTISCIIKQEPNLILDQGFPEMSLRKYMNGALPAKLTHAAGNS